MRWLLDQGLPRSVAFLLREAGHDAIHVGDIGMAAAKDRDLIVLASAEQRIIVTFDADFHSILASNRAVQPSVIRIREEGLKSDVITKLLVHMAGRFSSELLAGCLISYHNQKIRLRNLPLN